MKIIRRLQEEERERKKKKEKKKERESESKARSELEDQSKVGSHTIHLHQITDWWAATTKKAW